ncbi:unnamed protein product, partial [marine sediment metagenome]
PPSGAMEADMILEVQERLALLDLLPTEGDYASLRTLRRAREIISITPEEAEVLEFKQKPDGLLVWNVEASANLARDIPVDEWTTGKIKEMLINLSNEGNLKDMQLTLYEKFVVNYE